MLYWTLVFLAVAIIAGILGFGVLSAAAASIGKILFFIFLVALVLNFVAHMGRRPLP
jgi:uncharacterized membrane protein YtjA (UPF0391 family)